MRLKWQGCCYVYHWELSERCVFAKSGLGDFFLNHLGLTVFTNSYKVLNHCKTSLTRCLSVRDTTYFQYRPTSFG
jgi:hypothetical protein